MPKTPPPLGPKRTKFDVRREATHAELLRLGFERFPRKGYAATTIQDIVEGSGLTRGAFYFHFGSKEDFFLAVLRERANLRGDWWNVTAKAEPANLEQAVVMLLQGIDESADDRVTSWTALIAEFAQSIKDDPKYSEELSTLYAEQVREVQLALQTFADRGWVRDDVPLSDVAATVLAYIDGFGLHTGIFNAPLMTSVVSTFVRLIQK